MSTKKFTLGQRIFNITEGALIISGDRQVVTVDDGFGHSYIQEVWPTTREDRGDQHSYAESSLFATKEESLLARAKAEREK